MKTRQVKIAIPLLERETAMEKRAFLPVKSDVVFHLFYADERNEEFLISLLKSMLRLPEEDYHKLVIADPLLLREFDGDKFAIVDVKLYTKTGKVIHIEIQLKVTPELEKRIIFYEARLITEQMGSGDSYEKIKKVISIIITDEDLIPAGQEQAERYHHRFTLYDPNAGVEFSDILEIHTLELGKLPKDADGTELYDWAKFIAAETEEELQMVAERNPTVNKAVVKLRELSADERARDLYERREKARRDQESRERWARQQGMQEGMQQVARNALRMNVPIDDIIAFTGLTREEINRLTQSNSKA